MARLSRGDFLHEGAREVVRGLLAFLQPPLDRIARVAAGEIEVWEKLPMPMAEESVHAVRGDLILLRNDGRELHAYLYRCPVDGVPLQKGPGGHHCPICGPVPEPPATGGDTWRELACRVEEGFVRVKMETEEDPRLRLRGGHPE